MHGNYRGLAVALVATLLGCANGDEKSSGFGAGSDDGSDDFSRGAVGADRNVSDAGLAGDGDGSAPLPPEVEEAVEFEPPQASDRFVFAANPEAGTVAVINAETLHIQTLETGERPTYLRTLANTDDAIVLNVGSDDATIIRLVGGEATLSNLPVTHGANTIAVAPDGKHAVVLFDASREKGAVGFMDFQTVTVLKLEAGADQSTNITVGYNPRAVFFRDDNLRAYVVTDDGVSVLDFEDIDENGPRIADSQVFGKGGPDDDNADVSITPDGRYALSRLVGDSLLRLLDLESGETSVLDLADVAPEYTGDSDGGVADAVEVDVTDLDLAPDGSYAVAVLRSHSAVVRVPIPGGFSDLEAVDTYVIEGELIGLAEPVPHSSLVLAYTTASETSERLTILDLDNGEIRVLNIHKTIKAVSMAPDGSTAVIVHKKMPGNPLEPGLTQEQQIDRSYGYSVLHPDTGAVKLRSTSVEPGAFTVVIDAGYLFLLLRDDAQGVREVHRVHLSSFDFSPPIVLDSPPIAVGSVPMQKRVFVSQDHPEGRMTFIDWDSAESQTVTGYELNAKVRD